MSLQGDLINILVVSHISIPASGRTIPDWSHLRNLGHQVIVKHSDQIVPGEQPDVIISMGVGVMEETFAAIKRFPSAPLFCYQWDTYAWIWEPGFEGRMQAYHPSRGKEYNYVQYGELLRRAKEVWVPSECTGKRASQWWGIGNWHVILSSCPFWDHADVRDDGYALCCLREIPDPWWGVFERCCENLGIPYRSIRHEVSYSDYQDAVAHCRFLCSPLYELSTGGLSLLEGYYHGKPCLLNNSPWHGGKDYLGGRACYFRHGDMEDFKRELRRMYDDPLRLDVPECRQWVTENFSDKVMVERMLARIMHHAHS